MARDELLPVEPDRLIKLLNQFSDALAAAIHRTVKMKLQYYWLALPVRASVSAR